MASADVLQGREKQVSELLRARLGADISLHNLVLNAACQCSSSRED